MNPTATDAVIRRYIELGEQIKELQQQRADLVKDFPNGRTEGETLALYKSGRGWSNVVSIRLLRQFVTQAVLDRCSERKHRNGSVRVVPKAKPRRKKHG